MAKLDQDETVYPATAPESVRRSRRRKQAVVGVVGLVAVLGGGTLFVTRTVTGVSGVTTAIRGAGATAPMTPVVSPSASRLPVAARRSPPGPVVSKRVAARVSRTPTPGASVGRSVAKRIEAARAAAARDGIPLQRPVTPPKVAAQAVPPTVTNSGSLLRDGATLRVVTAKYDLTGQPEFTMAADAGERVGNAHCTQNFRFSGGGPAQRRPTMLLCWRISAHKSVLTLAVTRVGRPSTATSVAAIDKAWAALS